MQRQVEVLLENIQGIFSSFEPGVVYQSGGIQTVPMLSVSVLTKQKQITIINLRKYFIVDFKGQFENNKRISNQ